MLIALMILKIIGLILLFILALALVILAILLFTPIKYHISSNNVDKPYLFVKLGIWLNMVAITYFYNEDKEENKVILFWLKFDWDKVFKEKKEKNKKKHKSKASAKNKKAEKKKKEDSSDKEKSYKKSKYKGIKAKIKATLSYIRQKLSAFNAVKNKRELFGYLLELVKGLFKALRTKKFKAKIKFGFEEPDETGIMLGFGCGVNAFLPFKIDLEADFENSCFDYALEIKGKTSIFLLIVPIVKFVLNKPIWDLIFNGEEE